MTKILSLGKTTSPSHSEERGIFSPNAVLYLVGLVLGEKISPYARYDVLFGL